jgi:hypothetical protein
MSLTRVYVASSEQEAVIVKNLLDEGGVEAQISSDNAGGMLLPLQMAEGVAILVDEEDAEEAREILEEYRKGETAIDDDDAE